MPRLFPRIILAFLVSFSAVPPASAGWIWSPHTGWVGPSGAVRDTPEEQLAVAVAFFERQEYDRARQEFRKLLKAYKDSPQAPEAQYYLGRCEEEQGDYDKAFLEYRKTIQVYPSTIRFDEILEREYRIANSFLSGKKRQLFGIAALLPARGKAVEILQAIVEDGPFSEYGLLAQYKLGEAHLALKDYEQAVSAFEQVVTRYPNAPLVDKARFQIAIASLRGTFRAGYDQSSTDLAIQELAVFIREYPQSDLVTEAKERVTGLREQRAEHDYQVGQFYERRQHPHAAITYYEAILERFAETSWASLAAERLTALKTRL